jgi:hypothetical protein
LTSNSDAWPLRVSARIAQNLAGDAIPTLERDLGVVVVAPILLLLAGVEIHRVNDPANDFTFVQ